MAKKYFVEINGKYIKQYSRLGNAIAYAQKYSVDSDNSVYVIDNDGEIHYDNRHCIHR